MIRAPSRAGSWRAAGRVAAAGFLVLLATGCATTVQHRDWSHYEGPGDTVFHREELPPPDFPDPLEPWNRSAATLNHVLIRGVLDPVGRIYRLVVPHFARQRIDDFGGNLLFARNLTASLLEGDLRRARDASVRFGINTTVGLLGFFDPATRFGFPPVDEDFGQVFGVWGWKRSTYLVLPLLGPTTLRDLIGLAPDALLDPATYFFPASEVLTFNELADEIPLYERFVASTFDPYDDGRIAWLLNRDEEIQDTSYHRFHQDTGEVQTLRAVFLAPRNPEFPSTLKTGRVRIPLTGRSLPYSFRVQPRPAPLLYLVPGLGAHRLGNSSMALAEMAYRRGFSVVVISSALNFEFMERASSVAVPGNAPVDAHDVHVALTMIDRALSARFGPRLRSRVLMGYSLGAFHALFIEAESRTHPGASLLHFTRVVALDPPVQLLHGLQRLDAFYDVPQNLPPSERERWTRTVLRKALHFGKEALLRKSEEPYSRLDTASAGDARTTRQVELPFSNMEAEYLIGLSFRRTLRDVIYDSQARHDLGVLETHRSWLQRWPAYQEAADYSFAEYLYAFLLPYYRDRLRAVSSVQELLSENDLHAIGGALYDDPDVRVFANENDFLTTHAGVAWLRECIGPARVHLFPKGGHLGNLYKPEVQRQVMDSLADLLQPSGQATAGSPPEAVDRGPPDRFRATPGWRAIP